MKAEINRKQQHIKWANPLKDTNYESSLKRDRLEPSLVWLSGMSDGLRTKMSRVQFLVRAHAWVAGQVPS